MPLTTATDLAALIDVNDADEFTLADGSTFRGHLTQGYSDSLGLPGRRPVILALWSAVDAIALGASIDHDGYQWTVQHIERGTDLARLYLEVRA